MSISNTSPKIFEQLFEKFFIGLFPLRVYLSSTGTYVSNFRLISLLPELNLKVDETKSSPLRYQDFVLNKSETQTKFTFQHFTVWSKIKLEQIPNQIS